MANPYQVLGVHPDAEDEIIEVAYQEMVKKYHPDQGGTKKEFKRIQEAYNEIISDQSESAGDPNEVSDFDLFGYPVETNSVKGRWGEEMTIEGEKLSISLLGLYKTDVSDIAMDVDDFSTGDIDNRYLIIFNVKNISDNVQEWSPLGGLKIIGSDDFTYSLPPTTQFDTVNNTLPPRMTRGPVELEPGSKTNSIGIVEGMPDGIYPSEITYTHQKFSGNQTSGTVKGKNRFKFDLDSKDWSQLMPIES